MYPKSGTRGGSPSDPPAASSSSGSAGVKRSRDDDTEEVCRLCKSHRATPNNAIVFCDGCKQGCHQSCYGRPLTYAIPPSTWLCSACLTKRSFKKLLVVDTSPMTVSTKSGVICGDEGAPTLDPFDERGSSVDYKAWVAAQLRGDENFYMVFHWLTLFGAVIGVDAMTFNELELAFAQPTMSGELAMLHVRLLRCLGRIVEESNWHRSLGRLLQDEDPEVRGAYKDVIRLSEKLLQCKVSRQAATAAEALQRRSKELAAAASAAATRATGVIDDDDDDAVAEVVEGGPAAAAARASGGGDDDVVEVVEGQEEGEEEDQEFDYFLQPLCVRMLLLRRLCEEVLTCSHKNNKRLADFLRWEAAEAADNEDKPKKRGGAVEQHITLERLRDAEQPRLARPLFGPSDFVGPALPASQVTVDAAEVLRRLEQSAGAAPALPPSSASSSSSAAASPSTVLIAVPLEVAQAELDSPDAAPPKRAAAAAAQPLDSGTTVAADDDIIVEEEDDAPLFPSTATRGEVEEGEEEVQLVVDPTAPPADERSINYHLFQDSSGEPRLVAARCCLPLESAPRNPTIRTLLITRAMAAVDTKQAADEEKEAARAAAAVVQAERAAARAAAAVASAADYASSSSASASSAVGPSAGATGSGSSEKKELKNESKEKKEPKHDKKESKHESKHDKKETKHESKDKKESKHDSKESKHESKKHKHDKPSESGKKQTTLFAFGSRPITADPVKLPSSSSSSSSSSALFDMAIPRKTPAGSASAAAAPAAAAVSSSGASAASLLPFGSIPRKGAATSPVSAPLSAAASSSSSAAGAAEKAAPVPLVAPSGGSDGHRGSALPAQQEPSSAATASPAPPAAAVAPQEAIELVTEVVDDEVIEVGSGSDAPAPCNSSGAARAAPHKGNPVAASASASAPAASSSAFDKLYRGAAAVAAAGNPAPSSRREAADPLLEAEGGLVFVTVPAVPAAPAFRTIAVGEEELEREAQIMMCSNNAWTRAVGYALLNEVLEKVKEDRKKLERKSRKQGMQRSQIGAVEEELPRQRSARTRAPISYKEVSYKEDDYER